MIPTKEPLPKEVSSRKLCPKCKLPMEQDDVLNALSHNGKTVICSICGQIESFEKFDSARAEGLKIGQRRAQAAIYGLDQNGNPKVPKEIKQ